MLCLTYTLILTLVTDGKPYPDFIGNVHCGCTFREFEKEGGSSGQEKGEHLNQYVRFRIWALNLATEQTKQNTFPQDIVDAVRRRDRGVCCVTGRADSPTTILWAFPPSMAYMVGVVLPGHAIT